MANYMTTDTELTAIADAIRAKASGGGRSGYKDYILGLENSVSVNDPDSIITVTYPAGAVCTCSDGTTTLTAPNTSGSAVFGVEIGTWEIVASKDGKFWNEEVIIESRRQSKEIEITVLLSPIGTALNNCTWEEISIIAQRGLGDTYWDIGDCKAILLNGTIGDYLTLNNTTLYVFILDFNHPIDKTTPDNNIIFGGFKTALTSGKDIALCDSKYGSMSSQGYKCFNINHWGPNESYPNNNNYGGWKGCDLRYDILGSTSIQPSGYSSQKTTSNIGYDATLDIINTPIANTLISILPNNLRNILRLWTRYIDSVGGGTVNNSSCATPTIDILSLLAEYEIYGSQSQANRYEQNYQQQMTYYINGNSKLKYKHNAIDTLCKYWEASPAGGSSGFCGSRDDGYTSNSGYKTSLSCGLAPAFKV